MVLRAFALAVDIFGILIIRIYLKRNIQRFNYLLSRKIYFIVQNHNNISLIISNLIYISQIKISFPFNVITFSVYMMSRYFCIKVLVLLMWKFVKILNAEMHYMVKIIVTCSQIIKNAFAIMHETREFTNTRIARYSTVIYIFVNHEIPEEYFLHSGKTSYLIILSS